MGKLIKKARDVIKGRNLQMALLLGSLVAYLVVALVTARYFWGLYGLEMNQPLN
jgi:hypothetical protein